MASQIVEHRAGHIVAGRFMPPIVPIDRGTKTISGRTLVNDRAICVEAQERVPPQDDRRELGGRRTNRLSLSIRGDGFIEAIPDEQILQIQDEQCTNPKRLAHLAPICGQAIPVPILEAPGERRIGRFGWKDQHASLLSFAADAYLNEMGITNRLQQPDFTPVCDLFPEGARGSVEDKENDIDKFALFMRTTKVLPPATPISEEQRRRIEQGSGIFDDIGCSACHVPKFTTAPANTTLAGGTFVVTPGLGDKVVRPFSDFLLHDIGTGDGIAIAPCEHYGLDVTAELNKQERTVAEESNKTVLSERAMMDPLYACLVRMSERELFYDPPSGSPPPAVSPRQFFRSQPFLTDQCKSQELYKESSSLLQALRNRPMADGLAPEAGPTAKQLQCTANRLRTAPLWGLRTRARLMHDGESGSIEDAINRHHGEAEAVANRFRNPAGGGGLSDDEKNKLLEFLKTL
jgi:CxxC motif-containing protein (DUF1111 family)